MTNEPKRRSRSEHAYALLLALYPHEFRSVYGREMALVFAARFRAEARGRGTSALLRFWREAVFDVALSAPREHLENLLRGRGLMKTLRTIALALAAYAFTLLVVAPVYTRNAPSMPAFVNSIIDALISTGIIFNFIFLLLTLTGWLESVRAVRVTLALTTLIVATLITLITVTTPSRLNLLIAFAQVLSLLIWFTIHLWWVLRRRATVPPAPA